MNIQIFGTSKCFDSKKAMRYFKERGIKYQWIDMKEKGLSKGGVYKGETGCRRSGCYAESEVQGSGYTGADPVYCR